MSTMRCDLAALKPMTTPCPIFSARRKRAGGCSAATDAAPGPPLPGRAGLARSRLASADSHDRPRHRHAGAAPAAFREMAARRRLMVRPGCKRAIAEQHVSRDSKRHMSAAFGHAITACRDPDDQFTHSTSASACGMASARSSAINVGPAISAARPCSHTPRKPPRTARGHGHGVRRSCRRGRRQYPLSQAGCAAGANPAGRPATPRPCPAPCKPRPPRCAGRFERPLGLRAFQLTKQPPEFALVRGGHRIRPPTAQGRRGA